MVGHEPMGDMEGDWQGEVLRYIHDDCNLAYPTNRPIDP
jgi:hypothetical protein